MAVDNIIKNILALGGTDFSIKAIYKNRKSRYPIIGIFDEPYQGVNVAETEFASSTPIFTIPTLALPCRPELGDTLIIDCDEYTIRNFKSDGTGITVLVLEFATKLEIAEENNLLLQDGTNMLQESGSFILLETGNP